MKRSGTESHRKKKMSRHDSANEAVTPLRLTSPTPTPSQESISAPATPETPLINRYISTIVQSPELSSDRTSGHGAADATEQIPFDPSTNIVSRNNKIQKMMNVKLKNC